MTIPGSASSDDRLRAISIVTDAARGHLDVDDLLVELLARVVELLDADTAAVLLADEAGEYLVARATFGIEEEVRQGVRVPMGIGFAGHVAAERRPIRLDVVDSTTVWNPILWEKGIAKMLGVPLLVGPQLLGVLHVGRVAEAAFSDDDEFLLGLVAARISGAVQSRQLEVERAAARVVQRSLLPSTLPLCPGFEFATRYVPAEEGGVGGDWYDVFVLPSGDLWVMTGDVAGHGLEAAITLGRLRSALRAYSLVVASPSEVLARADRKFQFFDPGRMATVVCALFSAPYDRVRIAAAGHLPPVLAVPGRPAELLDVRTGPPLGVTHYEPVVVDVELPPSSLLLFFTDGLVERRDEPLDEGLARLTDVVTADAPEIVCRRVMASLVGASKPTDDIAVMALRRTS